MLNSCLCYLLNYDSISMKSIEACKSDWGTAHENWVNGAGGAGEGACDCSVRRAGDCSVASNVFFVFFSKNNLNT